MASTLNLDRELGPHLASELEDALFSTFQAYLFVADSQVSPADAAQQIDSLITDHDDRAGFLHTFWEMYFRFGCQVDGAEPVYRLKMASESEGDKSQRTLGRHCPSWDRIWWSDGIVRVHKYLLDIMHTLVALQILTDEQVLTPTRD